MNFSRTYIQLGLVEKFLENPETGSVIELRPVEVAFTSSRLEPNFTAVLDSLDSDLITSSFEPRALFSSGIRWRMKSAADKRRVFRWSLSVEFEGSGNLFHLLHGDEPAETNITLPSVFGEARQVQVARYTRWMTDIRAGWSSNGKKRGLWAVRHGSGRILHRQCSRAAGKTVLRRRPQQHEGLASAEFRPWRIKRRQSSGQG